MARWKLLAEPDAADAVLIKTYAFINVAKAESTETSLECATRKHLGQQLIVAGCLSQRFGEELWPLVPEINGVVGTGAYASIIEVLDEVKAGAAPVRLDFDAEPEYEFSPQLITTPRSRVGPREGWPRDLYGGARFRRAPVRLEVRLQRMLCGWPELYD